MRLFPWREEESHLNGDAILRPTIDVRLINGHDEITTKALIDTGAPRSVFPLGIGQFVGVDFPEYDSEATKKITLMGQTWPAISDTITLTLPPYEELTWEAEVDFVMHEGLPFALLGYEGFFNHWAVGVNGYIGYVAIEPPGGLDERYPASALAELREKWPAT